LNRPRRIFEVIRARRALWLLVATVTVSLVVEETYPFSHFPMYSRFHPRTWYVYATDANEEPLATKPTFGTSTPRLKKKLRAKRAELEEQGVGEEASESLAALALLDELAERAEPPPRGLKLWHVELRRGDGRVTRETRLVAERE